MSADLARVTVLAKHCLRRSQTISQHSNDLGRLDHIEVVVHIDHGLSGGVGFEDGRQPVIGRLDATLRLRRVSALLGQRLVRFFRPARQLPAIGSQKDGRRE